MKVLGILGGTGPEYTIDYYKLVIAEHRRRRPNMGNPPTVIWSVDYVPLMRYRDLGDWESVAYWFADVFGKLKSAGADFGLIAANTPHMAFEMLARIAPLPLLSIVDAALDETKRLGCERVGILGTKTTMNADFYHKPFRESGIELIPPTTEDQDFVEEKYFSELFEGVFLPETRSQISRVIERLRDRHHIDAVLLAGTELPLIMRDAPDLGIPLLDTAQLHCAAAVDRILDE